MRRSLIFFLLNLFYFTTSAFGQLQKEQVITSFDSIVFYSDSTIAATFKLKNNKIHGYSIEFDSLGNPIRIGKYHKGEKDGLWKYSNGARTYYKKGKTNGVIAYPGCTSGRRTEKNNFKEVYFQLTGIKLDN